MDRASGAKDQTATHDSVPVLRKPRDRRTTASTMMDIAREAGVAQSTVSRVLNDVRSSVPITDETRARIIAAAHRLDYRPNPFARALRGAPTMLIGAIVRDITDPFFMGAMDELSSQLVSRGYNVVLGHAHANTEEARALRAVLETRHCDGLVVMGDMRHETRLVKDLQATQVPVVWMWQHELIPGIPSITVDNRVGINLVIDHLHQLGHERIGFIEGRPIGDHRDRLDAFVDILRRLDAPPPPRYVQHVTNSPGGGSHALAALMALREPPTAVVAGSDNLAFGALHAAHSLGISVPHQLSVTGFDDLPMAAYTVPALTSIRMPTQEMVRAAVDLVIDGLNNDGGGPRFVHRPSLIVRASTAPRPDSARPRTSTQRPPDPLPDAPLHPRL